MGFSFPLGAGRDLHREVLEEVKHSDCFVRMEPEAQEREMDSLGRSVSKWQSQIQLETCHPQVLALSSPLEWTK